MWCCESESHREEREHSDEVRNAYYTPLFYNQDVEESLYVIFSLFHFQNCLFFFFFIKLS